MKVIDFFWPELSCNDEISFHFDHFSVYYFLTNLETTLVHYLFFPSFYFHFRRICLVLVIFKYCVPRMAVDALNIIRPLFHLIFCPSLTHMTETTIHSHHILFRC